MSNNNPKCPTCITNIQVIDDDEIIYVNSIAKHANWRCMSCGLAFYTEDYENDHTIFYQGTEVNVDDLIEPEEQAVIMPYMNYIDVQVRLRNKLTIVLTKQRLNIALTADEAKSLVQHASLIQQMSQEDKAVADAYRNKTA
jgi:hypothetical protein